MDKEREQPAEEPATALNLADECAVSEVGSQEADLGKFKNAKALLDAYNNLQAEFTKKCQKLSELEKDKTEIVEENDKNDNEKQLSQFLDQNIEAKNYIDELQKHFDSSIYSQKSPYEIAWANVVLSHMKDNNDKTNDPIINQYVLSDENVKNKIIENYLNELSNKRPPMVMSSSSGERLSGVISDSPTTLEEAKRITREMFS